MKIIDKINGHIDNHLSHPTIHYFLASGTSKSAAIHIASLYESIKVVNIKHGFEPEVSVQCARLPLPII
jgi:hypothetical protein